jgi:hypothetical protein
MNLTPQSPQSVVYVANHINTNSAKQNELQSRSPRLPS